MYGNNGPKTETGLPVKLISVLGLLCLVLGLLGYFLSRKSTHAIATSARNATTTSHVALTLEQMKQRLTAEAGRS